MYSAIVLFCYVVAALIEVERFEGKAFLGCTAFSEILKSLSTQRESPKNINLLHKMLRIPTYQTGM